MSEPTPSATYEITWNTGHIERIEACQVAWPNNGLILFHGKDLPNRVEFHGYVDGRWTLQLSALMDDIRTIRNVTESELIA